MFFNFLITSWVCLTLICSSGNPPLAVQHIETIEVNASISLLDALGNVYWVDDAGLSRYEPEVSNILNYSNRRLGPISNVDVSDPLNILVFYGQSGMIEFLDRNLAPRDIHGNLNQWLQTTPPSLVAASGQQGFWGFFPQSMSLRRFDMRLRQQAGSENIQQLLPHFRHPVFMVESQNNLFASCESGNIYVFDNFANFLFTVRGIETEHFQVMENNLIYFTSNEMRIYNYVKSSETVYLLPENNVERGFVKGQYLILQTSNAIHRYLLQQPIY